MKLLIAVSSKHGSTREIAGSIGETVRETGIEVDVVDPRMSDPSPPATPSSSGAPSTGVAGWGPLATS